ncbi:MAG: tripartite tricarboxylate transporter TctB family protein [Candidatus Heimdallarchaeota archaeon]|nr:tripartite tricarboxylate transporter TctB family protein [Candidatus Heimdallarchaeota archaeon]
MVHLNSSEKDSERDSRSEIIEEGEIDFTSLTDKEKDDIILEMHTEEMMIKRKQEEAKDVFEEKVRVKKRRKKTNTTQAHTYPGFGKVVIRMGTALAFSMAFILIGPIILFMSFFGYYSSHSEFSWWIDLVFALIGVGLTVAAWFLFRYILKD